VVDVVARAQEDRRLLQSRQRLLATASRRRVTRDDLVRAGYAADPLSPASSAPAVVDRVPAIGSLPHEDLVGRYGGLTALLLAAREGHAATASALVEGGADLNQQSEGDRTSPLLMAVINGHFDLAMDLLARGADPTLTSDANDTPLFAAINARWIPLSRHPQPTDHMSQETTYLELMSALLDAGADPNVRLAYRLWFMEYGREFLGVDWIGATPFLRAAHALDVDAMRLLLTYGADPGIPTMQPKGRSWGGADPSGLPPVPAGGPGIYPIHAATGAGYIYDSAGNTHRHVEDGWLAAARFFVEELGVDPDLRDWEGFTPLHNAAARGDNEVVLYLLGKGADPHLVARTGQTTVDAANGPHQRLMPFIETVGLLESLGVRNNARCVSC
jgi:ankyrin repeat protein